MVLSINGQRPSVDSVVADDLEYPVGRSYGICYRIVRILGVPVACPFSAGHTLHRVKKSEYATVDLYSSKGDILIPAYTRETGELGKMPTFCSNEWKQRVMHRWADAQGVKQATVWMGMTIDELQRVKIVTGRWEKRYPLVELRMTRGDCIAMVKEMGWPEPPKSTCWMCPNKLPSHWEEIRGTIDWHRAVKFEEEMQEKDPDLYLHRQGVNLQDIEEDTDQYDMFCDSGMCFV